MKIDLDAVKKRVIEMTVEITGEGSLPEKHDYESYLEKPLQEIGVDSLSALELAVYLEREFATRLDEQELSRIQTLADIVKFVEIKAL
jgi:acyl carrier protein